MYGAGRKLANLSFVDAQPLLEHPQHSLASLASREVACSSEVGEFTTLQKESWARGERSVAQRPSGPIDLAQLTRIN
jgi:hypothetical protein